MTSPPNSILLPAVAGLLPAYPDLNVEISVNNGFVDIVAERFDAGVRLGETLAQDMVAVRIGPDMRMAVVGSPAYFAGRPLPRTPHDLAEHICIGLRYTAQGGIGVWDFEKAGRAVNVRVEGQLIVSNIALARLGALQGARAGLSAGGVRRAADQHRRAGLRSRGVVRALSRLSPVLPQPSPAHTAPSPYSSKRCAIASEPAKLLAPCITRNRAGALEPPGKVAARELCTVGGGGDRAAPDAEGRRRRLLIPRGVFLPGYGRAVREVHSD